MTRRTSRKPVRKNSRRRTSLRYNARAKKPSDKLRDMEVPMVLGGYELDRKNLVPVRPALNLAPGDYGCDPIGPSPEGFMFRMVPSGDIVTQAEKDRRLKLRKNGGCAYCQSPPGRHRWWCKKLAKNSKLRRNSKKPRNPYSGMSPMARAKAAATARSPYAGMSPARRKITIADARETMAKWRKKLAKNGRDEQLSAEDFAAMQRGYNGLAKMARDASNKAHQAFDRDDYRSAVKWYRAAANYHRHAASAAAPRDKQEHLDMADGCEREAEIFDLPPAERDRARGYR